MFVFLRFSFPEYLEAISFEDEIAEVTCYLLGENRMAAFNTDSNDASTWSNSFSFLLWCGNTLVAAEMSADSQNLQTKYQKLAAEFAKVHVLWFSFRESSS